MCKLCTINKLLEKATLAFLRKLDIHGNKYILFSDRFNWKDRQIEQAFKTPKYKDDIRYTSMHNASKKPN
jgi:hypothetical protein